MKEKIRCKACGYIVEKDALGEVCPACGVKKEMFEPWDDKVGALRRFILEKDIHPVVVHAPEALAFILLFLGATFPLFPIELRDAYLWPSVVVLSFLFPVTVFFAFVTGLFDAMVRFRKVATPVLLQKQILGFVLFASSVTMFVIVSNSRFTDLTTWLSFVAANLVAMGSAAVLGLIGAKLVHAVMPGDKIFMPKKKKPAAGAKAPAAKPATGSEAPAPKASAESKSDPAAKS